MTSNFSFLYVLFAFYYTPIKFYIMLTSILPNRPLPSFPWPLYQNEVKCSAFDMEIIFNSLASETHFHKKGCALSLILKVRVFGTRMWPIQMADPRWPMNTVSS